MLTKLLVVLTAIILTSWPLPAQSPARDQPAVLEKLESLEVLRIDEEVPGYGYRIELRNVSSQGIRAIFTRETACTTSTGRDYGDKVVAAGETGKIVVQHAGCRRQTRVEIVSVLFEEGSCEGDKTGCARIEARREARRLAASLELPILQRALENPDFQRMLEVASKIEMDEAETDRLIEGLALHYPGSIDNDWETVIDDFAGEFRLRTEWFQQQLEALLRPSGDEDIAGGIRQQIKQCEQTLAEESVFAPARARAPEQSSEARYREAYEAWMKAAFEIGIQWWFTDDYGAPTYQPLRNLRDIGPNVTPFLVEELRREPDEKRIFRLSSLLRYLSDIDLLLGKPLLLTFQEAYRVHRGDFLAAWDSGVIANPTERRQLPLNTAFTAVTASVPECCLSPTPKSSPTCRRGSRPTSTRSTS